MDALFHGPFRAAGQRRPSIGAAEPAWRSGAKADPAQRAARQSMLDARGAATAARDPVSAMSGDSGDGDLGQSAAPGHGAPIGREPWPWEEGFTGVLAGSTGYKRPRHHTDETMERALDMACATGDRGRKSTGVRAWKEFVGGLGQQALRPLDHNAPLWVKLEEEVLAMRFVCALVEVRGVVPDTASQYFSTMQGWHRRETGVKIAGGLKLERLPEMLKGLRRLIGDTPKRIRRGVAPQALRTAMDMLFDPTDPADANIRAALATGLQGMLRCAEFTAEKFDPRTNLTRSDIKRCDERMLVIMIHPCKNMHELSGKTSPLVIGAGGRFIDAAAEVANMLRVDPVPSGMEAVTPLFRDPVSGQALRQAHVMLAIRRCMARIGEDPAHFGTHSLRIGGATALFAAGADATVIRTMGRWSSDLYRLYVRACFEKSIEWSKRCGSTSVREIAGVREFYEVDYY